MTHKHRTKQIQRVNKKYKNLAGIVAAATILSTTMLPGLPSSIAHASASASSNAGNMSATTSQQVAKASNSGIQLNFSPTVVPASELNAQNKTLQPTKEATQEAQKPQTTKDVKQESKATQPSSNAKKAPVTTPKPIEQANPNAQPDPNITKTSTTNAPTEYKQVLDIKATAYAPGPHDNAQWGNKTYIGTQVRPGIIAVDPNVIPLGSRVYIQYPDGHGEYAVAEDTGGAIKGNRVDIAKWTVSEAEDFGIQNVKVYVVSTPNKV